MTPILSETLAPPDDHRIGLLRIPEEPGKSLHLLFHEEPRKGREEPRHPHHAGMGPVGTTKGIQNKGLPQPGVAGGKIGIVLLLPWLEAHVFQESHLPRGQGLNRLVRLVGTGAMGHEADAGKVAAQSLRHRGQGVLGVHPLGPAQVGEEDQGSPGLEEVAQGGKAFLDAGIVLHHALLDGDVVVHPHQDALPPGVQVL